jgi:hypothetical protein
MVTREAPSFSFGASALWLASKEAPAVELGKSAQRCMVSRSEATVRATDHTLTYARRPRKESNGACVASGVAAFVRRAPTVRLQVFEDSSGWTASEDMPKGLASLTADPGGARDASGPEKTTRPFT